MDHSFLHKNDEVINGRYKISSAIGKGATGEVYTALDLQQNSNEIAIKYLKWLPDKPAALAQFKSEFTILTHLSHPGIAKVYDLEQDEDNKQFFFTSELISGHDFMTASSGMSVDEIEELFVQSLRALEYLHSSGIFHFDIKSANLLVTKETSGLKERILHGQVYRVKLIDFGLASIRFQGIVAGTPSYMAPEMVRRESPDGRADLYSLGVLVYSALIGANPFRTKETSLTMQNQLKLIPPPPSAKNKDVPKHLDSVIMRLMEKRPADRYQTAADVIRDLNIKSPKKYAVETSETQISYIPWESKFIGRTKELTQIKYLLDSGQSAVVVVNGASGSGKSRFLTEIKYQAQVSEWATFILSDTSNYGEWQKSVLAGNAKPTLVGIDDYHTISKELWGSQVEETCKILAKRIEGGAAENPVIMVITTEHPIPFFKNPININLANFDISEIISYLSTITGLDDPPKQLVEQISSNSCGSPFVVTELIKALVSAGMLVDSYGRWLSTTFEDIKINLEKLVIPSTVEDSLLVDFVSLPEEPKAIASLLAVRARPSTIFELSEISEQSDARKNVVILTRTGLIRFNASNGRYFFTQPLTAKAIYNHLSEIERSGWHDKVLKHIKQHTAQMGAVEYEEFLYHTSRGSDNIDSKKAFERLIDLYAANQRNHFAIIEAKFYLQKWDETQMKLVLSKLYNRIGKYDLAIETVGKIDPASHQEELAALEIMGIAYLRQMNFNAARQHFFGALQTASDMPQVHKLRIENFIAEVAYFEGNIDRAVEIYKRTAESANALPVEEQIQIRNNNLGQCYFQKGEYKKAIEQLEADMALYKGIDNNRLISRTQYMLAEAYRMERLFDKSYKNFSDLIDLSKQGDDHEHLFRAYNGLGNLHNDYGKFNSAASFYERALDIASRFGFDEQSIPCITNLGIINSNTGNLKKAEEYFTSALAFFEGGRTGGGLSEQYHCRIHLELGELHRLRREFSAAKRHLEEAGKMASEPASRDLLFWVKLTLAKLSTDEGFASAAQALLAEAKDLADSREKLEALHLINNP